MNSRKYISTSPPDTESDISEDDNNNEIDQKKMKKKRKKKESLKMKKLNKESSISTNVAVTGGDTSVDGIHTKPPPKRITKKMFKAQKIETKVSVLNFCS